jgi:hypothetical protein
MSENLFLYSEQYNQSSWINQNSFETINAIASPDGLTTAEKLIGDNGQANRQSIYQTVSVTSGTTYTFSVFLKQAERRYATIWFDNASITEGAFYGSNNYIDLQTGTIANSQTQTKIVAYPSGWYRCYVTATPSFTGNLNLNTSIGTPNNAADGAGVIAYQYTGDGVSGFYISKGQFERGTLTDYTPTTTTAVNRVLPATTNTNITGLGTYYSSGFDENVGFTTFLSANVFAPYDLVYDEFGGTLFGAGQGRYMRQYTDKSVIVYNEIDEVTDFRDIVRSGLVLDLDAGMNASYSGSGTTWTDLSVYGNNGTLTNGPTYSSANGGSIVFDGTNDFINIPDSSLLTSTSALTINCWVRATAFSGAIIGKGTSDSNEEYCVVMNSSSLYFDVGGGGPYAQPSYTFNTNTWYNICCVHLRTAGTSSLLCYVNGVSLNNSTIFPTSTPNNNSLPVSIGSRFYSSINSPFNGNIAQVSIYNRALSAAEVSQNYNALKHRFGL